MSPERSEKWYTDDDRHGLPYLKDYRVVQVSTHGHGRPVVPFVPGRRGFVEALRNDSVPIPPRGNWAFEEMEGPGKIVNFWCTALSTMDFNLVDEKISLGAILRNRDSIRHMIAFDKFWNLLRNVWVQIHFDDSASPAVNAPMGDFFGVGFGEYRHYMSRYLMMTAGGYVCQFHMPFRKKARVVLVNKNEKLWVPAFYGAVTYLQYPDAEPLENQAYFHAAYREEAPTQPGQPYLILDTTRMGLAERPGHFVGVVLNTEGANKKAGFRFLEGNTKIWVDSETEHSLEYTGLEDYYQGGWYYRKTSRRKRTEFCAPYHGLTIKTLSRFGPLGTTLLARQKRQRLSQYRFHPEGIPFRRSIRVAVHHGEFDEVETNFSSVAYWYQQPA